MPFALKMDCNARLRCCASATVLSPPIKSVDQPPPPPPLSKKGDVDKPNSARVNRKVSTSLVVRSLNH